MLAACYGADTVLIPSLHQPALVLEFARSRDLDSHVLLRGTGLFEADMAAAGRRITPMQLSGMLGNLARALPERDVSFQLGQQWLPGHYGSISLALMQASHLEQALDILLSHQATLCPLLGPRYRREGEQLIVYWTDSCGAGALRPFLVELHMTALTAMCRWLSGERLPWRYCFNRTRPRYLEQHEVHLGGQLQFGSQFDGMLLDAGWLSRPWSRGNERAVELLLRQAGQDTAPMRSLLQAVYDHLLAHIRRPPSLEGTAQAFGVSPATLKRHLARDGTHFQALLDLVRTHVAICLMQFQGYDPEALADYLGFHDARNFRRSFQRWTGLGGSQWLEATGLHL
ncbi:AraC family transcriptional regulator [Chitinimonas naiadis]